VTATGEVKLNWKELILQSRNNLDTEWLRRRFCKKYNLPWTHPTVLDNTEIELLLDYTMDMFEGCPDHISTLEGAVKYQTMVAENPELAYHAQVDTDREVIENEDGTQSVKWKDEWLADMERKLNG